MEAAAWGLLGTLVGAFASIGTTWLSNKNAQNLLLKKDRSDRVERSRAFQRETLLVLQEAIHDELRLVVRCHMADFQMHKSGVPWGSRLLPDDLSEEHRLSSRRRSMYVERVIDDDLRNSIKAAMLLLGDALSAKSREHAEDALMRAISVVEIALEDLGKALRSNY